MKSDFWVTELFQFTKLWQKSPNNFWKRKIPHLYTHLTKNKRLFQTKQTTFPNFVCSSISIWIPSKRTIIPAFTIFLVVFVRVNRFDQDQTIIKTLFCVCVRTLYRDLIQRSSTKNSKSRNKKLKPKMYRRVTHCMCAAIDDRQQL